MQTGASPISGWPAFAAARSRAVQSLRGRVLEIGAGQGANFDDLNSGVQWLGLEPSPKNRRRLADKAQRYGHRSAPLAASAEDIPLRNATVDGVLGTTVLCSVSSQRLVLNEIDRILVPGGRAVLAEHVGATRGTFVRKAQTAIRPLTRLFDHGCDPTRDTEGSVRASTLQVDAVSHFAIPVLGRLTVPFVVFELSKPEV